MIGSSRITVATGFNETIAPLSTTSFVCSFNHSLVHFICSVFWMFVGSFVFFLSVLVVLLFDCFIVLLLVCLFVCLFVLFCLFRCSFILSLRSWLLSQLLSSPPNNEVNATALPHQWHSSSNTCQAREGLEASCQSPRRCIALFLAGVKLRPLGLRDCVGDDK